MSRPSLHDAAWQKVFDDPSLALFAQIQKRGCAYVSADELKAIGGREPRLMAKQDSLSARPEIFERHHLTIFPVENGRYVIFPDQRQCAYFPLAAELDAMQPARFVSISDLRQFDTYPDNQHFSETQAIDFAYLSGMLQAFAQDDTLALTLRGRLRSRNFSFLLPDSPAAAQVSGVQIEVDSGYESDRRIYLIEAKIGKRDDFHLRQLLYPYLEWSQRSRKEVVPLLLLYSNGLYYFLQFRFHAKFGDARVVKKQCYALHDEPARLRVNLSQLLRDIPAETEPEHVPFPQADDLDKIIDLANLLAQGATTKTEIADYFDFDERQADYYANAAAYLGWVTRQSGGFALTEAGEAFTRQRSRAGRIRLLLTEFVKKPTFRAALTRLRSQAAPRLFKEYADADGLAASDIMQILRQRTALSEQTAYRRAFTMKRWMQWVLRNCEEA